MPDYSAAGFSVRRRDERAEALRQRQLADQRTLNRLQNRVDYIARPGVVSDRDREVRRMPAGEQIVRDPSLLRKVIVPTPMTAVPQPVAVSTQPYSPAVRQVPLKKVPSLLYTNGLPTGSPVKKWPTSFKKALEKPTTDVLVSRMNGNLGNMANSLLGRTRRR